MGVHVMETEIYGSDYTAPEIREIFDEKAVVESWLMYEGILAEVQGELGVIPEKAAREIKEKATLKHVKFERIVELYPKTKHAGLATVRALAEVCEPETGEYVHYGSCAPEMWENTLAYRLKKAMDIYERESALIRSCLNNLADVHRDTLMVERSLGQQALPTTFGFVAAIWSDAISKHLERFQEARKRILMGFVKGVVGTYASHYLIAGEKCLELEKMVLERLGLFGSRISFRRHLDRLTEFMYLLSLFAVTFEKIFDDIFFHMRSEIGELEEPPAEEGPSESSTLPQKRNPVRCQTILAWCKRIRSNAAAFAETHMRQSHDTIGFTMENLIIPETCVLAGTVLSNARYFLENMTVNKAAMRRNLESSNGLIMTEALMLALSKKTGKKQTAHAILHRAAMEAREKGIPFREFVLEYPAIIEHLAKDEVQELLKPENYLGLIDMCIDRVIQDEHG